MKRHIRLADLILRMVVAVVILDLFMANMISGSLAVGIGVSAIAFAATPFLGIVMFKRKMHHKK